MVLSIVMCLVIDFNYPQYIISNGNTNHLFAVDTSNGTIYNTGYLMYEQQQVLVCIPVISTKIKHIFQGNSKSEGIAHVMIICKVTVDRKSCA